MEHIAIENLRMAATKTFAQLDTELERVRKEISKLNTPEARKMYAPDHIRASVAEIQEKAKQIGALQRAELLNHANRLNTIKHAWSTDTLMKRARFFPASDKVEYEIAEELRRLRLSSDLRDATAPELVEMAQDARQTGSLATLQMIAKESQRRMYESDSEKALVRVEVGKAIAEVGPEGQRQAHALIAEVEKTLEGVEDCVSELLTGQEPKRSEMRRMIARQSHDDDQ